MGALHGRNAHCLSSLVLSGLVRSLGPTASLRHVRFTHAPLPEALVGGAVPVPHLRLPATVAVLRNATLPSGDVVDVRIAGSIVAELAPAGSLSADPEQVLDLTGHLLLPAAGEAHAHLEKALTFDRIRPPQGDLRSAIESFHAYAAVEDAP